jgi:hypothetical protein
MSTAERGRHHLVVVECAASGFDRASRHLGSLAERHGLVMSGVTPTAGNGADRRVSLRVPGVATVREAHDFVTELLGRLRADTAPFRIIG